MSPFVSRHIQIESPQQTREVEEKRFFSDVQAGTDSSTAAEGVVVAEFGVMMVGVLGGGEVMIYVSVGDILKVD
jgi:hypothetical protein